MWNVKKTDEENEKGKRFDPTRLSRYNAIQDLKAAGHSRRKVASMLGYSRNTVNKYYDAKMEDVCRKDSRKSILDPYYDDITKSLKSGMNLKDTYDHIVSLGFSGGRSRATDYMKNIAQELHIEVQKYYSVSPEMVKKRKSTQAYDYLKRTRIFKFLWMNEQLEKHQKEYLLTSFPIIAELYIAVQEFRQIFNDRSLPFLHLFVDKFKHSELKSIASFASGLEKDIEAIENAVTSHRSNGFVEGTISKLKMKKRMMYGRAKPNLLASKMMYKPKI
jgi:transposase